ncbi:hypothetical protein X011_06140 [Mycobacterium tuberculosis variant microti OV254]|nr:hypothetical protein X011_06140 [Mycobacterium tuberculosis variant microti OV254]BBX43681.1 hypothetical protein MSIM_51320 [Mycobacterium simiae]
MRTLLHSIYDQPDADSVAAQYVRIVDALDDKLPKVADHLENARPDLLAFTAFPKQIWRQIWSNNPEQRLNKEIRRRTVHHVPGLDRKRPVVEASARLRPPVLQTPRLHPPRTRKA